MRPTRPLACGPGAKRGEQTIYCCNSVVLPPTCAVDPDVRGCTGVAIGYACVGTDSPNQANASLACSTKTAQGSGRTETCCIPFPIASGCSEDDAVPGCGRGSYGFSCDGSTRPDALNPTLACDESSPGLFCCRND